MKNIVLFVPSGVVLLFLFSPILFLLLKMQGFIDSSDLVVALPVSRILSYTAACLWLCSVTSYFAEESGKKNGSRYLIWLFAMEYVILLLLEFYPIIPNLVVSLLLLSMVYPMVKVVQLVHNVFYERSVLFIVLELFVIPIGITTLTPTIQRAEKEIKEL